jgi:hypothetical protein
MITHDPETRMRIDIAREAIKAHDELEQIRAMALEVVAQAQRLTYQLAAARAQLARCPLCRFKRWLASLPKREETTSFYGHCSDEVAEYLESIGVKRG